MLAREKKVVYITPNKPSELLPLLGEALLLYDQVALDLSTRSSFNVLAANIGPRTLETLLDENIIIPVYDLFAPVVAKQTKKTLNSIMLLEYKKNGIPPIDFEYMNEVFKPVFPKSIIDSIQEKSIACNVDHELLLENIQLDFKNVDFITSIFDYVKEEFNLPEYKLEIEDGGCYIIPNTKNKEVAKRVLNEATYGLHLLADINYKSALLSQFDEIICESELENFFVKKLRQSFRTGHYKQQSENLLELCEIYDFPDIKELVASGMLTLKDILTLRKKEGQFLRAWLDSATRDCIKSKQPFSREFTKLLINSNKGMSLPTRTVIFGFLQVMSFIKPVEAVLMSAANEYLMPHVVKKWQPKYFFDKARKLQVSNKLIRN
ncbi:hypothetical protein MKY14_13825 [Paenibacillus sp. FSL R5-0887]|uniref:hypothetical protein n=1 Tax=unclassified Paenibacillus TaxID=185978 RepID=UPI0030F61940